MALPIQGLHQAPVQRSSEDKALSSEDKAYEESSSSDLDTVTSLEKVIQERASGASITKNRQNPSVSEMSFPGAKVLSDAEGKIVGFDNSRISIQAWREGSRKVAEASSGDRYQGSA